MSDLCLLETIFHFAINCSYRVGNGVIVVTDLHGGMMHIIQLAPSVESQVVPWGLTAQSVGETDIVMVCVDSGFEVS